jgi:hypothetical protein
MRFQNQAEMAPRGSILDNRKERCRMQAQLVLIQSLSLALDAQMNFEVHPRKTDEQLSDGSSTFPG